MNAGLQLIVEAIHQVGAAVCGAAWDKLSKVLRRIVPIAGPGFNRWMVPPAALAVHLCIGQAYAFSVFNGPLTKAIGITQSAPDDWKLTTLGWIFSLAIVFLGLSAAFGGKWLEKVGPRVTMAVAACCFGGGFLVSSVGVSTHQIWPLWLTGAVVQKCLRVWQ